MLLTVKGSCNLYVACKYIYFIKVNKLILGTRTVRIYGNVELQWKNDELSDAKILWSNDRISRKVAQQRICMCQFQIKCFVLLTHLASILEHCTNPTQFYAGCVLRAVNSDQFNEKGYGKWSRTVCGRIRIYANPKRTEPISRFQTEIQNWRQTRSQNTAWSCLVFTNYLWFDLVGDLWRIAPS